MNCFKKYKNDRTCELCELVNNSMFEQCKEEYKKEYDKGLKLKEKLKYIKKNCPYRINCWEDYHEFDGCNKNDNGYKKFTDSCKCTLECEKYLNNK